LAWTMMTHLVIHDRVSWSSGCWCTLLTGIYFLGILGINTCKLHSQKAMGQYTDHEAVVEMFTGVINHLRLASVSSTAFYMTDVVHNTIP
jgi:hypothetical protein